MDLPELTLVYQSVPIPPVFYSSETGAPFARCIACERELLKPGVQYVIEKAIKRYPKYNISDTIFEYAMCLPCYEEATATFSETSVQNIQRYFDDRVDLLARRNALLKAGNLNVEDWISRCVVKGTPVLECSECQLVCQCNGRDMLFSYLPFAISGEAMDEVAQLLSNKTIDEIDGFYDRFLSPPPDVKEILKNRPAFVY